MNINKLSNLKKVGLVSLTLGSIYLSYNKREEIKYLGLATVRCGRIVPTSLICFYDYHRTLNPWIKYKNEKEYEIAIKKCNQRCADRTLKVIEKNAGIFIKLGQHISALTYLLPSEWTNTFIVLQDNCPKSSIESLKEMINNDSGKKFDEWFSSFDDIPLGTASLAQVHKAVLKDTNQVVAVKLQHPSLKKFVPIDVAATRLIFNSIEYFFPDYSMTWLADELESSLKNELNFNIEAENAINTQNHFKNNINKTALRIPNVFYSTNRILIQEFLPGARLDDFNYFYENNISCREVSTCLSYIFNDMIFSPGASIHCDPHGGNLAIRAIDNKQNKDTGNPHNFEIILYDHGLYRNVPLNVKRAYAHLWLAILDSDIPNMRKYAWEFAGIDNKHFNLFASAITGRAFDVLNESKGVITERTTEEKLKIAKAFSDGSLFLQLIDLLASMPRIVLLILKTNDLVRALDESLTNNANEIELISKNHWTTDKPCPESNYLIMASYAAHTVYQEALEKINFKYTSSFLNISKYYHIFIAWVHYFNRCNQLRIFNMLLWAKTTFNI